MSVIFGKLDFGNKPVGPDDLSVMKTALDHWNAEDSGLWYHGSAGLGHLMLYNTPESLNEKLPYYKSDSQLAITADARIDNREELYALLRLNTPDERKLPDSSLILLLYEKYGSDCVKHLIGDFAFAIWDERQQQLFCARDHMGVKPFFYYDDGQIFAFASEKKGILAIPGINKEIDKQFFYNQLYRPSQQRATTTLYQYIRRLAPAHTLTLSPARKEIRTERYWTLDIKTTITYPQTKDYEDALKHYFDMAVKCRMRTAFPLGVELSGGLDSSAILGAACKYKGDTELITFSSTHDENDTRPEILKNSELAYIEESIRFNHIKESIFVTENPWPDPMERVDLGLFVHDGLEMWDTIMLLPVKLAASKRKVRTLISGHPGDEMVTYRGKHFYLDLLEQGEYLKYFKGTKTRKAFIERLLPLVPYSMIVGIHNAKNIIAALTAPLRNDPFIIPFEYASKRNEAAWTNENHKLRFKSYRHYLITKLLKPQVGLRMETETRYGIYFRHEPRFPMADIRLTQFYLSTPNHMKHGGGINRNMYRNAVSEYLPEKIFKRNYKTSNMAPFLYNLQEMDKKRMYIQQILNEIDKKQSLLAFRNKDVHPSYLPVIRWLQQHSER